MKRPEFSLVKKAQSRKQLRIVYSPATVYDVSSPLLLNGLPFGTIRIGVSTLFLRSEIEPRLLRAVYFSIASIIASLLLAAGVHVLGDAAIGAWGATSGRAGEGEGLAG